MKPNNKIIISTEIRPCYVMVNTEDRHRAFFHCWTCEREQYGEYSAIKVFALCEFENGSLKKSNLKTYALLMAGVLENIALYRMKNCNGGGNDNRC